MSRGTETFFIDTEVSPAHLPGLLTTIHQDYILPHRERFAYVKHETIDRHLALSFTFLGPAEEKWYIDVEVRTTKPIEVRMLPSDLRVPPSALQQLREDLFIVVQLFEEKVRKTTLYFAWAEGERTIAERITSRRKGALGRLFSESMLLFFILFLGISILLFAILQFYVVLVIIAFQFAMVLLADRIIARQGEWTITPTNHTIHFLQYPLPSYKYAEFIQKYGMDSIAKMKQEIYEKTLTVGKELDCKAASEVFSKYGIECSPENMTTKSVNVYGLVKRAAERFNQPMPKIAVTNVMMPNAAAAGPSPKRGVILITTGLLVQLEEDEILSVLGHELSHLKGRDPLFLFGLTATELLLRFFVFLPIFFFFPIFYLIFAMGVIYFIAKFFEAKADLESVSKIGQPKVMAGALRKIGFWRLRFERIRTYRAQAWLGFDPHPSIYFRVDRLEKLQVPIKSRHPLLRSIKDVINGFRASF